ncbi:hypothetical protein BJ322DRAFT_890366 [Thelephora terrestris]|uniref:Uncharacterized protein n=1 Tax=Thelephora terrestris TaxID=56493 RepID=A0A9P6HEF7_9AGAM|nr:hypothetical protein BJ322DRAFT_890366 [Thelephora terrestris]
MSTIRPGSNRIPPNPATPSSESIAGPPADLNPVLPRRSGSDTTIIRLGAILDATLTIPLFAAFIATMLNGGSRVTSRSSNVDLSLTVINTGGAGWCKMNDATWHSNIVTKVLCLKLHPSLVVTSLQLPVHHRQRRPLSRCWFRCIRSSPLLFIVCPAALFYNLPFKTPLSVILCVSIN